MRVLVIEENLVWSSRLSNSLVKTGHESVVRGSVAGDLDCFDVAIVNLGSTSGDLTETVTKLKNAGIVVVGHAGHKEKDLHDLGRQAGCDLLATNSELTFKLESLLAAANHKKTAK